MQKRRPKYLNLLQIRLPVPGIVSIMHRASGAVLFLVIPLLLWALQESLASPAGFAAVTAALTTPLAKLILIALLWGFFHHFFAGIRYLALDIDVGTDLPVARATSWAVLGLSIAMTLVCGVLLW